MGKTLVLRVVGWGAVLAVILRVWRKWRRKRKKEGVSPVPAKFSFHIDRPAVSTSKIAAVMVDGVADATAALAVDGVTLINKPATFTGSSHYCDAVLICNDCGKKVDYLLGSFRDGKNVLICEDCRMRVDDDIADCLKEIGRLRKVLEVFAQDDNWLFYTGDCDLMPSIEWEGEGDAEDPLKMAKDALGQGDEDDDEG